MNAAKSSFGGGPAPDSIDRTISHAEPRLQIEEEQLGPLDGNTLSSAVRIESAQGGVDVTVVFDRK